MKTTVNRISFPVKKFIAFLLAILIAASTVLLPNAVPPEAKAATANGESIIVRKFFPRETVPSMDDYWYFDEDNLYVRIGCAAGQMKGNQYRYGNCTHYAYSRASEIMGEWLPTAFSGNGATWWYTNKNKHYFPSGSEPKIGAIAVFDGKYGHVAIVEKIEGNDVYLSESGLAYRNEMPSTMRFNYGKLDVNTYSTTSHLLGYIYIIDYQPCSHPTFNDDGYCIECGAEFELTENLMTTLAVTVKKCQTRTRPYLHGTIVTKLVKNSLINIVASVTNSRGSTWYVTDDHSYIFSENIKLLETTNTEKVDEVYKVIKKDTPVRALPYEADDILYTLDKGSYVTVVEKFINGYENEWVKTTEGEYIYAKNLQLHKHSFASDGFCKCGADYICDETPLENTLAVTTKKSVKVYIRPYTYKTDVVATLSKGESFHVTAVCENAKGKTFYYAERLGWVQKKDISIDTDTTVKATAKTTTKATTKATAKPTTKATAAKNYCPVYTVYEVTVNNCPVRDDCYETGSVTRRLKVGEKVNVAKVLTNSKKNRWLQLDTGEYLFDGNAMKYTGNKKNLVVTKNDSPIRSTSYESGSVLRRVSEGAKLTFVREFKNSKGNTWFELANGEGYIFSGNVKKI